jgi:hypothetical protein
LGLSTLKGVVFMPCLLFMDGKSSGYNMAV